MHGAVTFEIVTDESSKHNDVESRGWDTEPEGDPVDYDPEEEDLASATARWITHEAGGVEASNSDGQPGTWYSEIDCRQDRDFFESGIERRRSFHLRGFTVDEQRAVCLLLK